MKNSILLIVVYVYDVDGLDIGNKVTELFVCKIEMFFTVSLWCFFSLFRVLVRSHSLYNHTLFAQCI